MCDLASKQVLQTCDDLGLAVDSSATGRFMSPDWSSKPEPVPYAKLGNPQTRRVKPYATEKF